MENIQAPWTDDQVDALNTFQRTGRMHPFTCGKRDEHPHDEGVLVARTNGWHCPVPTCSYRQIWAPSFMTDPSLLTPAFDIFRTQIGETPAETFRRADDTCGEKIAHPNVCRCTCTGCQHHCSAHQEETDHDTSTRP